MIFNSLYLIYGVKYFCINCFHHRIFGSLYAALVYMTYNQIQKS